MTSFKLSERVRPSARALLVINSCTGWAKGRPNVVLNHRGQGASGGSRPESRRDRRGHHKWSFGRSGRHGRHPRGAVSGSPGAFAAFRGDNPSAAGRFTAVAATRLRAGTGGRSVAGIHGEAGYDRAWPAIDAATPRGRDRNGGRSRPPRDAPESTCCRSRSRRAGRLRLGRQSRLSMLMRRTCVTASRATKKP
jgi:hypothetical protein